MLSPTLETKRLILRRYVSEGAAAMYQNWASDSEVTKYLMWQTNSSEAVSPCYYALLKSER